MSTDSIFNETNSGTTIPNTNTNSTSVTAPVDTDLTDLLGSIKNERGEPKYKTLKDAIVGLQNAQEHIPTLRTSLAEKDTEITRLRAEANRVATLEEAVRNLTERSQGEGRPPKAEPVQDVAELVNRTLNEREVIAQQKTNIGTVVSALQGAFGADAESKFNSAAAELGMSVPELNALAAKSPRAVLKALGVDVKQATKPFTASQGSINSQAFTPNQDTAIGRNQKPSLVGATTQDLMEEHNASKAMVAQLHKEGKSVHDLTDPKVFFKTFR